jgi:hypothetical protein
MKLQHLPDFELSRRAQRAERMRDFWQDERGCRCIFGWWELPVQHRMRQRIDEAFTRTHFFQSLLYLFDAEVDRRGGYLALRERLEGGEGGGDDE